MIVFEATDPRGYKVVCTEERWNQKILGEHPSLAGCEDEVKGTIENPLFISEDREFANRICYYRIRESRRHQYMKVVVDFGGKAGRVVTAFPTDSGKQGESVIWLASSD